MKVLWKAPVFAVLLLACSQLVLAADHPMIGQEAPAVDLASLGGDQINIADQRGKHIVLHFGAGW